MTIPAIDLDLSIQQLLLQSQSILQVNCGWHWHALTQANLFVFAVVDFGPDILEYPVRLIYLCQLQKILVLFNFHQLNECLTSVPVLLGNFQVLVQRYNGTTFLLELHVHLTDSINGIGLLPDKLQISFALHPTLTET